MANKEKQKLMHVLTLHRLCLHKVYTIHFGTYISFLLHICVSFENLITVLYHKYITERIYFLLVLQNTIAKLGTWHKSNR